MDIFNVTVSDVLFCFEYWLAVSIQGIINELTYILHVTRK